MSRRNFLVFSGTSGQIVSMSPGVFIDFAPSVLIAAFGIAFLAGVVKGAVGFAMPLVMVSGLSSIMDPKLALAGMIIPVVLSNTLQTFREGVPAAAIAMKEHWRYVVTVCVFIFLAAQLVTSIPSRVFYLVLGVPVVALSLFQLSGRRLHIPHSRRRAAEWMIGSVSGLMGGLAGTWGPTTVLYLIAIETPKTKQMVVQGVIYGIGSVTLLLAHLHSGILNAATVPFSASLLLPGLIGLWMGFKIQDRLDQARFRRLTLGVLVVAGLNLLRKGYLG